MSAESSVLVPAYLNQSYFEDVLKQETSEPTVAIRCLKVSAGSNSGDNYCSQIFRVKIGYQRSEDSKVEEISLIVKSIPLTEETSFLEDWQVYQKESVFYLEVLPRLEALLNNEKIAPKCYFATQKPVYTIVFEDMNALGYGMADREIGYDEYQTKVVLSKLGRYHAASMIYAKENPEMMAHFTKGFLHPDAVTSSSIMYRLFSKYLAYEIDMVSKWEGFEEITRKLRRYQKNLRTEMFKAHSSEGDQIKVLNHGDFWVNNMLIKRLDDKIEDVSFIDFQMNLYASPGIDLNYFLHNSVQLDVFKKKKELLRTYYDAFSGTLERLHYDEIPTFEDIVHEFHRKSATAIVTLYGPFPIMCMDKNNSEGNSFESLLEGEGCDAKMEATFNSKRMTEQLRYALKELDEIGALDKF